VVNISLNPVKLNGENIPYFPYIFMIFVYLVRMMEVAQAVSFMISWVIIFFFFFRRYNFIL